MDPNFLISRLGSCVDNDDEYPGVGSPVSVSEYNMPLSEIVCAIQRRASLYPLSGVESDSNLLLLLPRHPMCPPPYLHHHYSF